VPKQPQPSGDDVPLGHAQALHLGWKFWPVVVPPGMQLLPDAWGHIASVFQVMEDTWPEGRTAAEVGAAMDTLGRWW